MAGLLKDLYSPAFYERFSKLLKQVIPGFEPAGFLQRIFSAGWENMELKERMRHTANVLHHYLPADFEQAAISIEDIVTSLQDAAFFGASLEFMFLPDYIEQYGIAFPEAAIRAFEILTPFSSCEFAVRPFIKAYPDKMMQQMLWWSTHPNHHIRRLASEGCRPRLPWAMALPALKQDPSAILPILENLKQDPSEYVRRSVANNLNDIAKDHPTLVISIARNWKGIGPETEAIIKHGCRSLLKQGHKAVLAHYGLKSTHFNMPGFSLVRKRIKIGDALDFRFNVSNLAKKTLPLRLEYAIYFNRKNGTLYRKVFKISERSLAPGESISLNKKHRFKPITTRQYYPGKHQLAIILNGSEKLLVPFVLA